MILTEKIKSFIKSFDKRNQFFKSIKSDGKVLDIGCGLGNNAILIKKYNPECNISGIDTIPEPLIPKFINYTVVDLEKNKLPFADNTFDYIIFTHVIEHLNKPMELGKEINRVLKQDGTIYLECPNWTSILVPSFGFHREQHQPFNFYDDPTHIKPWTKHGLFEFLDQGCNLEVSKVGSTRNWFRIPIDIIAIIAGIISGKRSWIVSSFWNIYGWCIYATGKKIN